MTNFFLTFFTSLVLISGPAANDQVNKETKTPETTKSGSAAQDSIVIVKSIGYEGQRISFDFKFGQLIKIQGWDKNEIEIVATRKTILTPFEVEIEKDNNLIAASVDWDEILRETEECHCDRKVYGSNDKCLAITFEIWVPQQATINLSSISADMELKLLHGPLEVNNISGFIDFEAPSKAGFTFNAKTITGEIYADSTYKLDNAEENYEHHFTSDVTGTFDGGGREVVLSTISSNIYLRRSGI